MKRTSKEVLEFFGLKVGDKVNINGKTYEVIDDHKNFLVTHNLKIGDNNYFSIALLTNKDYTIIKRHILTEKEREYLSNVIKPFRKDIKSIVKKQNTFNKNEFIEINLKNEYVLLPYFHNEKYYKGMKLLKPYTLEELGL